MVLVLGTLLIKQVCLGTLLLRVIYRVIERNEMFLQEKDCSLASRLLYVQYNSTPDMRSNFLAIISSSSIFNKSMHFISMSMHPL